MDMVPVPRPAWARSAAGNGLLLQSADGITLQLRERRAAVAALIDGRRTVRACFVDAGSTFESPQFVVSFCRELSRELWVASYCDLVHADAV
jgi:hypothetical protein